MTETKPAPDKVDAPKPKASFYFFEANTKLRGDALEKAVDAWADEISGMYNCEYTKGFRDDAWRVVFENLEDAPGAMAKVQPSRYGLH